MRLQPRVFHRRSGDAVSAARGLRHVCRAAAALLLLACSQAALALGLGDIRVLSKPGEPFLAEIPVISNEPGELERARVALAAPATFARVGLERPQGLVSDLQFRFTQTRKGRAVIQVSSRMPVDVPSLSFLIEVDWGQGRLIREYSALIDAPNTAAAIDAPAIDAPAAAQPSDRIARDASTAAPAPAPAAAATPSARPAATPRPAPAPAAAPGDALAPVRAGQTLSQIAGQLARGNGHSLDQTMVALLRANPDAFIRGNLNLLKQGAVLRTPREEDLASLDAAAAEAVVREQAAQWRQARAPVPQPAQAQQDAATAQAAAKPAAAAPAAAAAGARLEIAPAVPATRREAGTKSGTGAGDEGDMVAAQQLQQAREDLAARDAEVQELRSRVDQLEKLKSQQQQLIALKDSDLAAAQKRLAQAGQAPPAAAAAQAPANGGFPLWLWGGLSLLVLGLGAWLLSRRRKPSPLPPLPRDDDAALAAGAAVPVVAHRDVDAPELPPLELAEPLAEDATATRDEEALEEWERADHVAGDHADHHDHADQHIALDDDAFERALAQQTLRHAPADASLSAGNDDVHSVDVADSHPEAAPAAEPAAEAPWRQPSPVVAAPGGDARADSDAGGGRQEPTWHQHAAPASSPAPAEAPSPYPPAGRERLELAVAYMDLGDNETARTLLTEVAASGDPAARAEALQLLGRLD
ncbi:FimV/HubP family polar landmark protein [Xanthomonas sp. NCPPB 1128]|uniref:FimV/HubP family polar landmark protein n=1 Tax=Xanthomonas sp. NCPPB 1128 TaxID=1775876 RepID=UPI000ABBDE7B|nr:FimV/HubP family polar landmark protein [Xanthomonas sp. NCPPB 1128]